ncbi:hypothetical protein V502_01980 [Pseudogymnoascus sp. VKM F-4520 (FW-2644)]|nr:hypothetical protein V502_01980 [Pseudogymnoascus sp. VKM F-4520 (FW-2644)]
MASNITFDETIAQLTAMQEQLRISNPSINAIEMKGINEPMDFEDVSMDQEQAKNDTVDFEDLWLELNEMMIHTLVTQLDTYKSSLKKLKELSSARRKPEGPAEAAVDNAAALEKFRQSYLKRHHDYANMAMTALQVVRNDVHHLEDSEDSGGEDLVLLPQLCKALEHFFGRRAKMVRSWEKYEAIVAVDGTLT